MLLGLELMHDARGAAGLVACAAPTPYPLPEPETPPEQTAAKAISAAGLGRHIGVLASDAFEGRLPGTAGEDKTVAYLSEQFKALGLQPGNPDGRYVQDVPLVGINGTPSLSFQAGKTTLAMTPGKDFVAATARFLPEVTVSNSNLVFVGYGVQAPEYDWDDYKGLNVKGKTLVMLINDPPVRGAECTVHDSRKAWSNVTLGCDTPR